jgi:hypothetical protein
MKDLFFCFAIFAFYSCAELKPYEQPPSKPYAEILTDVETQKIFYKEKYQNANHEGKTKVIQAAKTYLFHQLTKEIFPSWYGTEWDFNGTTTVPKEGKIACGYFVTTTLEDLGLKIPRIKWAQAASETMIMAATSEVKRFSGADMNTVHQWLQTKKYSIFIVGLDNHTGFVYNNGTEILFVHSSPFNKSHGVVAEPVLTHSPLTVSKYRVFGEILTDDMVISWMETKPY